MTIDTELPSVSAHAARPSWSVRTMSGVRLTKSGWMLSVSPFSSGVMATIAEAGSPVTKQENRARLS